MQFLHPAQHSSYWNSIKLQLHQKQHSRTNFPGPEQQKQQPTKGFTRNNYQQSCVLAKFWSSRSWHTILLLSFVDFGLAETQVLPPTQLASSDDFPLGLWSLLVLSLVFALTNHSLVHAGCWQLIEAQHLSSSPLPVVLEHSVYWTYASQFGYPHSEGSDYFFFVFMSSTLATTSVVELGCPPSVAVASWFSIWV